MTVEAECPAPVAPEKGGGSVGLDDEQLELALRLGAELHVDGALAQHRNTLLAIAP